MNRAQIAVRLAMFSVTSVACVYSFGCSSRDGTSYEPAGDPIILEGQESSNLKSGCMTVEEPVVESNEEIMAYNAEGPASKRVIFLNRNGGTYSPGSTNSINNTSSIPKSTTQLPGYKGSNADWQAIVSCVKSQFERWNVVVTDVDPGNTTHIEAVVGGHPSKMGLGSGVGGIAPVHGSCQVIENAIAFIFSENLGGVRSNCEVIAHEVGHTMGLDHEYLCQDPMTYLHGCGDKTFQNKATQCGEYAARSCRCGPTQNSIQHLDSKLGLVSSDPNPDPDPNPNPNGDTTPPKVVMGPPEDGGSLPENSVIQVSAKITDDKALAKAVLNWNFNGKNITADCAAPPNGIKCSASGSTYTWSLNVGTGVRYWSVTATDTAGNTTNSPQWTLNLSSNPNNPPPVSAPKIDVSKPSANATYYGGDPLVVRALVTDDQQVSEVNLVWTGPGGNVTIPLNSLGNNEWGMNAKLSATAPAGERKLQIVAKDNEGNKSSSQTITIQVNETTTLPYE
jgi:hypothetical protein